MNAGKTLFAQIMEFVPWTSFTRIVHRYDGNAGVRTLSCAEQLRAMAFAQLTWRESLRDIEASLAANASKLYAMGFSSPVKRSTLADANESRDWRIWSDLAALLIRRARKLYAGDALDVGLDNTVYALDSSTVDLCLSLFEWAPFRSTKAAIKLHTLLDVRGSIPQLHPHQRRQDPRGQRAGPAHTRAGGLLPARPRLHGLRPAARVARRGQLLRDARQAQSALQAPLLAPGGQGRHDGLVRSARACSRSTTPGKEIPQRGAARRWSRTRRASASRF